MKMNVVFQPSWEVIEKPIFSNDQQLVGHKALFRSDNDLLLNVCKDSYTPTTNERFMEVVQKMNEITGYPVKCFDEFDGGKKVLAFLQCTDTIEVCGHKFEDYMLIGNSHDSSSGFFIGNSNMMIRCKNRFSKVFKQLKVHHTKHHDTKIEQLFSALHERILEPHRHTPLAGDLDTKLLNILTEKVLENHFCKWLRKFSKKENVCLFNDPINDLPCKAKLDLVWKNKLVVDLKTTSQRTYEKFVESCYTYDYDRQAAFYLDAIGGKRFIFVGIQKIKPFDIFIFEPEKLFIEAGREKYQRLLEVMKETNFVPSSWMKQESEPFAEAA